MPTYEYRCSGCDHRFELFQTMTARPVRLCPACRRPRARRLIGPGAALLFRGSGFYQTDYRSESYTRAAEADRKAAEPAPATPAPAADQSSGGAPATPTPGGVPAERSRPATPSPVRSAGAVTATRRATSPTSGRATARRGRSGPARRSR